MSERIDIAVLAEARQIYSNWKVLDGQGRATEVFGGGRVADPSPAAVVAGRLIVRNLRRRSVSNVT
jgi:hypothetical protein